MIKNVYILIFAFCILVSSTYLFSQQVKPSLMITDGPYISMNMEDELAFSWLCESKVERMKITTEQLPYDFEQCQLDASIERYKFISDALIYQGDFKVAAASDFHGQYSLMKSLLQNNKIIDQQGNWSFADGHFVITGDVFDRGDKVTEILWFLYKLEHQALQAGGQLHLLLGNHEVMILNGDLRYLNPKYTEVAKRLNMPFEQLFSKSSILGNWLRSKPVLVKVNNNLFAHGGFHPSLAKDNHSLEAVNSTFKANLIKAELDSPRKGWGKYLHKSNGPIWYRGYFKAGDEGASSEEIDLLLKHFGINHIIVGHTSQKQIETRYQGRVIAIDSSIKKGKYGEILFIESAKNKDDVMWRGSLDGKKLSLN